MVYPYSSFVLWLRYSLGIYRNFERQNETVYQAFYLQPSSSYQCIIARFEILTAVKIQVVVFWAVMQCSVVVGYHCFREPCYLHFQGEVNDNEKKGHI
jgi:hypothetical protein